MVNPAFPSRQLVGVFSLELARQYGYLYQNSHKDFVILHSVHGFDEVSLTGPIKVFYNGGEKMISPAEMGLPVLSYEDIRGGTTIEESANTPAQLDAVVANAAMALFAANQGEGLSAAVARAREALASGKAREAFRKLIDSQK
jgi:anthranilate phosphoribosyltransferase